MGSSGFIKKLSGKIFWNKVVGKLSWKRRFWRKSRCNTLETKEWLSKISGYPPRRRFRRHAGHGSNVSSCYPPRRRFRSSHGAFWLLSGCYPPCRRFRRVWRADYQQEKDYLPCRRVFHTHVGVFHLSKGNHQNIKPPANKSGAFIQFGNSF